MSARAGTDVQSALENPPVALLHEQARVLAAAAARGWLTDYAPSPGRPVID